MEAQRTTPGGPSASGLCPVCRLEPTAEGSSSCEQCSSASYDALRCPRCHNVIGDTKALKCKACRLERPPDSWPKPPFAFEAGYTVLTELDRDDEGVVYLAAREFDRDDETSRELVALKVGTDSASQDEQYESYRAESFKLGRFGNQPDILQVMGVERTQYKAPYLVTELAGGPLLRRVMEFTDGPLPIASVAWIGWKLAEALVKVHEQRLVHCGLTPSHIFILGWGSPREAIKLAGFGASLELHSQGSVSLSLPLTLKSSGDPRFTAPEQAVFSKKAERRKVEEPEFDRRADLYCFGLILHHMLTAASPFEQEPRNDAAWLRAHQYSAPFDPRTRRKELPSALGEVVLRCLEKDPKKRYESAGEVCNALKEVLVNEVLPDARRRATLDEFSTKSEEIVVDGVEVEQRVEELEEEVQRLQEELDDASHRLKRAVSARQRAEALVAAEHAKADHSSEPEVLRLSQRLLSRVTARFALLLPGTFTMGSPLDEAGRLERVLDLSSNPYKTKLTSINFEIQHEVTLSRPFQLQTTPVTQSQFDAVMGFNPSDFKDGRLPVESVSWYDAVAFCNRLSEQQGIPKSEWAYELHDIKGKPGDYGFEAVVEWRGPERLGFRLPTEAEWEYACRAGSTSATYDGELDPEKLKDEQPNPTLDSIAWFGGNSDHQTQKVATKGSNDWGLSDMLGNVWEWVWDWDDMFPSDPVTDPIGPTSGENRVIRGGSWSLYARFCRAAYRGRDWPGHRFNDIGFRPARTLP